VIIKCVGSNLTLLYHLGIPLGVPTPKAGYTHKR